MATGNIKLEIDPESYENAKTKLNDLLQIATEINRQVEVYQTFRPEGVFIATEHDGSRWVMFEDFITAQKSLQLKTYGKGWIARLANKIIGLGWYISGYSK